jgi:LytS/YehU family sensor histidine kinase
VVSSDVNQQKDLPNMLMQTWVENAIKHGIRHKEGIGRILVTIANNDSGGILVSVQDNGIGRTKAKELGTTGTGQGLKILAEQIAIYNLINAMKIVVNTCDLFSEEGMAEGTRFEMTIPFEYNFDF